MWLKDRLLRLKVAIFTFYMALSGSAALFDLERTKAQVQ